MDFIERLKRPERITDHHIVVFIIQLLVITGVTLAFFKLFMVIRVGGHDLDTEDSFISSVIADLRSEEGEAKFMRKIPTLSSDHEKVQTDKFIDIKNFGIWLTDKQDIMFTGYLLGCFFANIILVVLGAGNIYRRVREISANIFIALSPAFILVIPLLIWAGIMCIILYPMGIVTMFLAPFVLAYHLIMGIIQIKIKIKDRD